MKALLPALTRASIEPHLPPLLEVSWWASPAEATDAIRHADIAWIDMQPTSLVADTLAAAGPGLQWLNTLYAGLDAFPLNRLRAAGVTVTNGAGINAISVAEYAMLGMLAAAKRFDEVVRLADRHGWPTGAPGTIELSGSNALVLGMGTIGTLIAARLAAFGVAVTGVTRSGRDHTLTPDQWRARLGNYDWVILSAPSTSETRAMVGAAELAAMKPSAWLINVARGDMVDQDALVVALEQRMIAGAFLDTVHPEPLPSEHPLWSMPNAIHSMHLSGRSTTRMMERAGALFLENLAAFLNGTQMRNVVNLDAGY